MVESPTNATKIDLETTEQCTALQWLTPEQTSNKKHPYICPSPQPSIYCSPDRHQSRNAKPSTRAPFSPARIRRPSSRRLRSTFAPHYPSSPAVFPFSPYRPLLLMIPILGPPLTRNSTASSRRCQFRAICSRWRAAILPRRRLGPGAWWRRARGS